MLRTPSQFLACVSLVAVISSAAFAATDVTLYPNKVLQRIDGFGASDAWYAYAIHSYAPAQQQQILDDLFSSTKGAGLSLLRHRIPSEIEPTKGVWDWTQDSDTVWLSKEAVTRGVSQVWATVWSPPAWMKTNQDVNNGGAVDPSHYQDYATFLATYVQHYTSSFGVNIAGVSIANEPDLTTSYESSNWTSQQFHDFIQNNLMPTWASNNVKAQIIMPEVSGWSDYLAAATLADPKTSNFVGTIACHNYWNNLAPLTDALAAKKTIWETEVSNLGADDPTITDGLYWAQIVHQTLVGTQANGWHYWWLYSDVSDTTGQSLITGSPSTNKFTVKKRLWTIGNFSRFVRPGAHMVGVSSNTPLSGVYISAYANLDGSISMVAINSNSSNQNFHAKCSMGGPYRVEEYRTSAKENLSLVRVTSGGGNGFAAALAPMSVTTFHLLPTPKRP